MRRLFATMLAVTGVICVIGSTPVFARGIGHEAGAGIARGAGVGVRTGTGARIGRGTGFRQMPAMQNRIPAPLPTPPQAPIINGPLTPNGLPSMGNGL
jgi:hypothetical protein